MAEFENVKADGYTGKVEFDGRAIRIDRPGLRGKIGYGGKPSELPVADVMNVSFKAATMMTNGTITFITPGHTRGLDASDPNTVIFTKRQSADFVALRDAVWDALRARTPADSANLELRNTEAAQMRAQQAALETTVRYGAHTVFSSVYVGPVGTKELAGATSVFESGADKKRPTLTRVGAGAILAGPVGAIAGGMFQKDTSKGYVTIGFVDGTSVIIEGSVKDELQLRQLAAAVTQASLR